jgi:hypothetical protein
VLLSFGLAAVVPVWTWADWADWGCVEAGELL